MAFLAAMPRRAPWALSGSSSLIVAAVTLPLAYVVLRAFQGGIGHYIEAVATERMLGLLWRTSILIVGTLSVVVPVALTAAWLVVRTDLKWRRFWATVLASRPSRLILVLGLGGSSSRTMRCISSSPAGRLDDHARDGRGPHPR